MVGAKRNAGIPIVDLTETNPTRLFEYPNEEIGKAFARQTDFRYRPDPFGIASARESIAAYYAERGLIVEPSQVALTASTSEAYSLLFCAVLWAFCSLMSATATALHPASAKAKTTSCPIPLPPWMCQDSQIYTNKTNVRRQQVLHRREP